MSRDQGFSRRGFLTSVGVGAVGLAACRPGVSEPKAGPQVETSEAMAKVALRINGRAVRVLVEPRWSLLFVLREQLGLTGTKVGCERGECGACTVLVDDEPRYACMMLAVEADGRAITTVEGLMNGEALGPTQEAFVEKDAFQCGYCTPGQVLAVEALVRENPEPTLDQIQRGVSGNLCRCGAYANIFRAAERAAELRRKARTP